MASRRAGRQRLLKSLVPVQHKVVRSLKAMMYNMFTYIPVRCVSTMIPVN